jgi:hypothetical protein
MIYLYKKFPREDILSIIQSEFPNRDMVRFSGFEGDATEITHALTAQNLFGNDQLIFLSDIDRELWNDIINTLPSISEPTVVIWLEDSFPVAFLKSMPKHQLQEYTEKKTSEKSNPFAIANQLSSGSSSGLWMTYQELLAEGQAPEAIFGILWWKLKDIAKKKPTITPEFKKTLKTFLTTYSQARETGGELETGLEEVLLKLSRKDL